MEPFLLEWLNLLLRVAHVVAAIMWIGDSFLFMFMDSHLVAPTRPREGDVAGELWMTHSGGFYEVVKRRSLRPDELPAALHWFKWESYSTWITGFFLITVVYYLGGAAALVPADGPLGGGAGAALSLGLLLGGVLLYQLLCRTALVGRYRLFGLLGLTLVTLLAWGLGRVFTPRAVFLQIGAMLGTIMSSNVLLTIIPAQQHMLAMTRAGQPVDTSYGLRAKQRSTHNHYLTFPVLLAMLSNHLPAVYGHAQAWLILALLFVFAVGVKQVMILRGQTHPLVLMGTLGAFLTAAGMTLPSAAGYDPALAKLAEGPPVTWATVRQVLDARCVTCHAAQPTNPAFLAPPGGVMFETPAQVTAQAARIMVRAVQTRTMPLGNLTGMTDQERAFLGAWIAQGADPNVAGPSQVESIAPPTLPPPASGGGDEVREVFASRCGLCHGEHGKGDGPASANLNPKPRAFGDQSWQASVTDEAIKHTIVEGGAAHGKSPVMPAHPDLADQPELLQGLVEHIRSFGK